MIIDIHAQFSQQGSHAAPAGRLAAYAGVCRVDAVLVSNQDADVPPPGQDLDEAEANTICLENCAVHAPLLPLYRLRPTRPDSNVRVLAGALSMEPFTGAALSPTGMNLYADDERLDPYLTVLAGRGCPLIIYVDSDERSSPARVRRLAQRHQQVPVILCAHGSRPPRAAILDEVGHAIRNQDANLYLDTAHAGPRDVRTAVDAVGADRVLFGSDALAGGDSHHSHVIALLDGMKQTLNPQELALLASENARRLFTLDEHT